jgi:hypothetical protein
LTDRLYRAALEPYRIAVDLAKAESAEALADAGIDCNP